MENVLLKITQNYCKAFKKYGVKRTGATDSIEIHSIGCAQNTASAIRDSMNQYSPGGIVNAIVDAETVGKVIEILPKDNEVWADAGYGNKHSYAIEIAESDYMKYKANSAEYTVTNRERFLADIQRGYNTAVFYVAKKCAEYGFNPQDKLANGLHRVYSHQEANALGLASTHVDPAHIWKQIGKTMDDFRAEVALVMGLPAAQDIKDIRIGDSTVNEISKVVYNEAGVIQSHDALVAVAQCIKDMTDNGGYGKGITDVMERNFSAYGQATTTDDARRAVYEVFLEGKRRFQDAVILQFRSFTKYSDGKGNMDPAKCAALLDKYEYLGKDARDNRWGHFYFGHKAAAPAPEPTKNSYVVQAGSFTDKAGATRRMNAVKSAGFDVFVKKGDDGDYKVQCGAFDDKERADALMAKLKTAGFEAIIKTV